jgi:hypothetical protein
MAKPTSLSDFYLLVDWLVAIVLDRLENSTAKPLCSALQVGHLISQLPGAYFAILASAGTAVVADVALPLSTSTARTLRRAPHRQHRLAPPHP